jgi:hypothetical protein
LEIVQENWGSVFVDDMQDIGEYFLLLRSFSSCCVGFNTTALCQCLGAKSDPGDGM